MNPSLFSGLKIAITITLLLGFLLLGILMTLHFSNERQLIVLLLYSTSSAIFLYGKARQYLPQSGLKNGQQK